MYVYGTQYWCVIIADLFVSLTMTMVYLPVFYGLGITSSYEVTRIPLLSSSTQRPFADPFLLISPIRSIST